MFISVAQRIPVEKNIIKNLNFICLPFRIRMRNQTSWIRYSYWKVKESNQSRGARRESRTELGMVGDK